MVVPPSPPSPPQPASNSSVDIEPFEIRGKYQHSNIHQHSGLITLDEPINGIKYAVVLESTEVKGSLIQDGVEVTGTVRIRAPRSYILSEVVFPDYIDDKQPKKKKNIWLNWFDTR